MIRSRLGQRIDNHVKCHLEIWGAGTATVIAGGLALGAAGVTAASQAGVFGGPGGGGGAGGAGGAGLPPALQKLIADIANTELPKANLPNINYSPEQFDVASMLQGTSRSLPTYTTAGKGRVPMYKYGPGGKVQMKNGKPQFASPDGKPLYTDSKFVSYKVDPKTGKAMEDDSGNRIVDVDASTKLVQSYTKPQVEKGSAEIYGTKVKPVDYKDTTREYTPTQATGDLVANTGNIRQATADLTAAKQADRETVAPGSQANMDLATGAIGAYLRGEVPQDVVDQTNRVVADRVGGGFNPFAPDRNQIATNQFSRAIGTTSDANVKYGIGANATQTQLADSLTFSPQDAISAALGLGNLQQGANSLTKGIDENTYTGNLTNSYLNAAPDPRAAGFLNDKINLVSLNNANELASDQFNFGNALTQSQLDYQRAMDAAGLKVSAAQLAIGGQPQAVMGNNGTNWSAIAGIISGAGNTVANIYGNYARANPSTGAPGTVPVGNNPSMPLAYGY